MRILVVDDDVDSREIASKALAVTGASVTQACSGPEALEHWRKERFDVLICDLAMPGMDGYEVLRGMCAACFTPTAARPASTIS